MKADELLTEAQFQTKVINLARARSWRVHHTRPARKSDGSWSTPIQGDPGFPDLVLARDGRVMFVELKAPSGRISQNQREWLVALGASDTGWNVSNPLRMTATADGSALSVEVWRPDQYQMITEILQ